MNTQDWSYDEFLGLVLIYSAQADLTINEEESSYIKSKIGDVSYDKVLTEFEKANDFEVLNTIQQLSATYCADEAAKDNVLNDIRTLFAADHEISSLEVYIEQTLSKLI